jgi:hypothetical protein
MDRGFRRGFTAAERTELWDRWQRGESLKAIGRARVRAESSQLQLERLLWIVPPAIFTNA